MTAAAGMIGGFAPPATVLDAYQQEDHAACHLYAGIYHRRRDDCDCDCHRRRCADVRVEADALLAGAFLLRGMMSPVTLADAGCLSPCPGHTAAARRGVMNGDAAAAGTGNAVAAMIRRSVSSAAPAQLHTEDTYLWRAHLAAVAGRGPQAS